MSRFRFWLSAVSYYSSSGRAGARNSCGRRVCAANALGRMASPFPVFFISANRCPDTMYLKKVCPCNACRCTPDGVFGTAEQPAYQIAAGQAHLAHRQGKETSTRWKTTTARRARKGRSASRACTNTAANDLQRAGLFCSARRPRDIAPRTRAAPRAPRAPRALSHMCASSEH